LNPVNQDVVIDEIHVDAYDAGDLTESLGNRLMVQRAVLS